MRCSAPASSAVCWHGRSLSCLWAKAAGDIAFYAYIVPFLVSTVGGSIIAGIILFALEKNGTLKSMQNALNK